MLREERNFFLLAKGGCMVSESGVAAGDNTQEALAKYNNTFKPKPPIRVYIDVNLETRAYEGSLSNVLSALLSVPDHPSLAAKAVMGVYAAESLESQTNGSSPKLRISTRMEGEFAVLEIVEPAEQGYLSAHLKEITGRMKERRYRPVVGIAHSRGELSQTTDWHSLYEVEIRTPENCF